MNPMFYFLLALTAVLAAATANARFVLDVDGNLISNGSYYVVPVSHSQGGGLTLHARDGRCPLDIVQESSMGKEGIPIKFSNWRSRVEFVLESENLNIETDVKIPRCFQSTYWWINAVENVPKLWLVSAGPKPHESGKDSSATSFQIVKYGDNYYKFAVCPEVHKCFHFGLFVDKNGVSRLALQEQPFLVMFKKATVNEKTTKFLGV